MVSSENTNVLRQFGTINHHPNQVQKILVQKILERTAYNYSAALLTDSNFLLDNPFSGKLDLAAPKLYLNWYKTST
jgi:hypothetical protein